MSTVQSHSPAGPMQLLLTNKIGIIATAGLLGPCRCAPPGKTFIIIGRESRARLKQDGCEAYLESSRLCLLRGIAKLELRAYNSSASPLPLIVYLTRILFCPQYRRRGADVQKGEKKKMRVRDVPKTRGSKKLPR